MGEAGRCLLPIGVILRILDWTAMRGGYEGLHRFRWLLGLRAHGGVWLGCLQVRARASSPSI